MEVLAEKREKEKKDQEWVRSVRRRRLFGDCKVFNLTDKGIKKCMSDLFFLSLLQLRKCRPPQSLLTSPLNIVVLIKYDHL